MGATKIHQKEFYPGRVSVVSGVNIQINGFIYDNIGSYFSGEASFALTDNATNYVMLEPTIPAVMSSTIEFSETSIALATVICSGGAITSITDKRSFVGGGIGGGGGGGSALWKQGEPIGDIDGINDTYTLPSIPDNNSLLLTLDGSVLELDVDYTLTSNIIVFTIPPTSGSVILYYYTLSTPAVSGYSQITENSSEEGTITGLIDSINQTFTLHNTPANDSSVILAKNGIVMTLGATNDYTLSGKVISFSTAPTIGDILTAKIIGQIAVSQVDDDAYSSSWNGNTTVAPTKNSIYDKIESTRKAEIEAHTSNDTLTVTESNTTHTNEGASGDIEITLPPAATGLRYSFIVLAEHYLKVKCAAGETASYVGESTAAGGYFRSQALGNTVTVLSNGSGSWIVISLDGEFTFDS